MTRMWLLAVCLATTPIGVVAQVLQDTSDRPLISSGGQDGELVPAAAPTFRNGVELVGLSVVVTDADERYVTALGSDDFVVYEDGVQQDLSFFSSSGIPLDLAILLDTSASMIGRLETAQEAAVGLLSTLGDEDRVIVVDIKDPTTLLFPLGKDEDAARRAILSTTPTGSTALYNGTYLALKEMVKQRRTNDNVRRQAIVVLSDGADTASLVSYDDVMEVAKRSGIAIFTVSLRPPPSVSLAESSRGQYLAESEYAMKALAQETGARAFFPADVGELPGIYSLIAEELANQYALGYTSKNTKRDGAYRRLIVRVTGEPDLRTRTRAGYLSSRAK